MSADSASAHEGVRTHIRACSADGCDDGRYKADGRKHACELVRVLSRRSTAPNGSLQQLNWLKQEQRIRQQGPQQKIVEVVWLLS